MGAEKRFKIGIDVEYNSYYSKRYAECVGKIDTKSIYIENAGSILKQEEFIDNLSSGFKRDLEALKLGQMTYSKFFNNYGTHLITNYIIGDRFYGNAVFVSNEILIDTSFNVGFENSIGGTFSGSNIGAGISNNIDIKTDFKLNEKKNKYACEVSCASDFVFSNVSNIANSYKEWVQYTNSHKDNLTTVVDYDMDDLVPVWDLLPPNYENLKKDMEFEFFLYRLRNEKNYYFDETTFDIDLGPKKIVLLKQKKLLMI